MVVRTEAKIWFFLLSSSICWMMALVRGLISGDIEIQGIYSKIYIR